MPIEEIIAVRKILAALQSGELVSALATIDEPAGIVIRHLVAGAMDPEYRQALKMRELFQSVDQKQGTARVVAALRRALALTRGQIDVIYGPPESELGYLGRRLWRPIDLIIRGFAALKAKRRIGTRI